MKLKVSLSGVDGDLNALLELRQNAVAHIMLWIDNASPAQLKSAVVSGQLAPSTWSMLRPITPYPAKLTDILIKSSANESLTDLANTFYTKSRKLDAASVKLLQQDVLSKGRKALLIATGGSDFSDLPPINGMNLMCQKQPAFCKKLFLLLSQKDLDQLTQGEYGDEWKVTLKSLGLVK